MNVKKDVFGQGPDGGNVDLFTLTNSGGLRVKIMTYGATITSVEVPDRHGRIENVTLSLDTLEDYLKGHPCFGSTIGRYANRIARGRFRIGEVEYKLATNIGPNHLHGGIKGFDKVVWRAEPVEGPDFAGVVFSYESRDGEEGYPGRLSAQVTYSLTEQNELKMAYLATTDKPTVVNLTNHAYWNLACRGAADCLGHELTIHADRYLPVDDALMPTGEIKAVAGTPMDFTRPHTVGSRIAQVKGGYDHCYVLNKTGGGKGDSPHLPERPEGGHRRAALVVAQMRTVPFSTLAARVFEPASGRVMEVHTTQPGVQLYTSNGLDGSLRSGGVSYGRHAALCLETQHFPDSPNRPDFPSTLLEPGQRYEQVTIHKFSVTS
jgi:aldose 1-epimerase